MSDKTASIEAPKANSFAVASQISEILKDVPKSQQKEIFSLLASQLGMRLIPVGLPIGKPTDSTKVESKKGKEKGAIAPQQPKAIYRSAEWLLLESQRKNVVDSLKAAPEDQKVLITANLRKIEGDMKALKSAQSLSSSSSTSKDVADDKSYSSASKRGGRGGKG